MMTVSSRCSALTLFLLLSLFANGQTPPAVPAQLTLAQAEQLAVRNNPQISISKLGALAEAQVTRQVRSAELPNASGNLTAVLPHAGSRIAAGGLNNPLILERAAGGVTVSQLITDFGRTPILVQSARYHARAADAAQIATSQDIRFAVDDAFYRALSAQALVRVAEETVNARQTTTDQVSALTNAKLKSDLDLSFANVNLAQAKLLLLDAQNGAAESLATLNTLLGFENAPAYTLVETIAPPPALPTEPEAALVRQALRSRPDLLALDDQFRAAQSFARSEHELYRPTLSGLAAFGGTPVRGSSPLTPWYGAAGINLNIPIFNGFQYSARANEADYRRDQASEQVRDLRNRIAHDVRVTLLNLQAASQRTIVTAQLLQEANTALDLATTRYKLGLSSIVELSQAQLQQTQAAIGNTNARYDYQSASAALGFQLGQ
ncbi:MAG: TolC family protein [Acidobacteriaceae bacterium]